MLEPLMRQSYQKICVDPLVKWIGFRLSPITVTLFAGISGMLFIPCLLAGQLAFAVLCLLLSGYFDTVDGALARYQNTSTPLGSALDIMTDRLVEFSVILGFYWVDPTQRSLAAIVMLGSILLCITSFLVVGIFTSNHSSKSFHYSPGLIERTEAFLFFITMIFIPSYFTVFAFLFAALVTLTAFIRLWQFSTTQKGDERLLVVREKMK